MITHNIEKIVLLDKVFFKILSSETDIDFEMNLETFLPKLLLKLGSAEDVVRKKIMEILVHVNKRVKSRPDVQLPFDQLIAIFNESAKTPNLSFVTVCDRMQIVFFFFTKFTLIQFSYLSF